MAPEERPEQAVNKTELQNRLLREAGRGNRNAFAQLYDEFSGPLYRFAFHMLADRAQAEDVVHETFLKLLDAEEYFDESRGTALNFAFGIARKLVLRHARWKVRWVGSPVDDFEMAGDGELDAQETLERAEMAAEVRKAVASLPVKYREVVTLCELCDMRYADAAAHIGCSIGTVRSRLHRAHGLLTKKLKRQFSRAAERPTLNNEVLTQ
jgi:RNA polymerase sigma-70 factor (ECF subfamily)